MKNLIPGIIAMAAVVVASNILVQFLFGNWLTWGAFTYPIAFLITDLMNRIYGVSAARRVVFAGFVVGIICSLIGSRINWSWEAVPLLGQGPLLPLWVSLAVADWGVKLGVALVALVPFRLLVAKYSRQPG